MHTIALGGVHETPLLVSYTAPHAHLSVSVSVDSFNSSILYNVLVSRRRREGVCVGGFLLVSLLLASRL